VRWVGISSTLTNPFRNPLTRVRIPVLRPQLFSGAAGPQDPEAGEQLFQLAAPAATVFCRVRAESSKKRNRWPTASAKRQFQLYRRGRYCGIQSRLRSGHDLRAADNGRTRVESCVAAPLVRWEYGHTPGASSREALLTDLFNLPPGMVAGRIN